MVGVGVSRRKPVGPRRAVSHRENADGVGDLSVDYQALMAAALDAGADGLGARRAAVALGRDSASASRVEGARARLKRLVERGWLVEEKRAGSCCPRRSGCLVPSGQTAAHDCGHRPQDYGLAGVGAPFVPPDQAPAAQEPGKVRYTE